jgi:hypothetical protein
MRSASVLAALTGTFLMAPLPARCAGEPPPDVRTVTVPQAEVWCGPSTANGLYPTNLLRQGDRVQVERELDSGWLVVRPPAGSFSWINNRFVQYISSKYANYVVTYDGHDVPVLIGSSLKVDRPTKIGVRLPRGAQVRIIGRSMTDEEGTWLPIEPPEGEVRYLRKEAVAKPGSAVGRISNPSYKAPVQAPDPDTLWADAQKADNAGRLADAVRLYHLAGDANLSINPTRAEEAYRRANWIEQANSSTNAPRGSYYYPDSPTSQLASRPQEAFVLPTHPVGSNVIQPIGGFAAGATNGQLVSTRAAASSPSAVYYTKGRLQFASNRDGYRRYHLLDDKGHPLLSVRAGPQVDLSSFENHNVELWGQSAYIPELRNFLMTVSSVREMP